jgi:hypothetical protein
LPGAIKIRRIAIQRLEQSVAILRAAVEHELFAPPRGGEPFAGAQHHQNQTLQGVLRSSEQPPKYLEKERRL